MSLLKKKTPAQPGAETTYASARAEARANAKAAKAEKPPKLSKSEMKTLKAKRKQLRRDLKRQGVKKRSEFEMLAQDVGLGFPKGSMAALGAGIGAQASLLAGVAAAHVTIPAVIATAAAVLAGTFLVAYVTEEKGHFTINLTADMLREGFQLSETPDFTHEVTRLFADKITNVNATSIYEMNRKMYMLDGSNNGPGYMSYTFYLRNAGTMPTDYGYSVNILSSSLTTSAAAWMMFFEDDKQIIYAQRIEETGEAENLFGYPDAPFIECAYDPETQYVERDGQSGIITTPFIDAQTALQGYVEDFQPGEVKKYTVVVWLEGDDPDCNNDILGGHVGFNIQFERLGEDETGFFKGLYRTEYDKYYETGRADDPTEYEPTGDEREEIREDAADLPTA